MSGYNHETKVAKERIDIDDLLAVNTSILAERGAGLGIAWSREKYFVPDISPCMAEEGTKQ